MSVVSFRVGIVPTLDGKNEHFVFSDFDVRHVEFRAVCGDEQRSETVNLAHEVRHADWSLDTWRRTLIPDPSRRRDTRFSQRFRGISIAQRVGFGSGPTDSARVPDGG
jgi:hypothetical protein